MNQAGPGTGVCAGSGASSCHSAPGGPRAWSAPEGGGPAEQRQASPPSGRSCGPRGVRGGGRQLWSSWRPASGLASSCSTCRCSNWSCIPPLCSSCGSAETWCSIAARGQLTGFQLCAQVMNSMMLISTCSCCSPVPGQRPPHQRGAGREYCADSPEDAVEEVPDGSVEFEGSPSNTTAAPGVRPLRRGPYPGRADGGHPGRYWLGQDHRAAHSQAVRPPRTATGWAAGCAGTIPGSAGRGGHRAPEERSFRHRRIEVGKPDASDEELWVVGGLRRRISGGCQRAWTPTGPGGVNVPAGRSSGCIARTAQAAENPDSTTPPAPWTPPPREDPAPLWQLRDVIKLIIAQRIVMHTDQIVILEDGRVYCGGHQRACWRAIPSTRRSTRISDEGRTMASRATER